MEELNDNKFNIPKVERTPKQIRKGPSMTEMSDVTFPIHDSVNTRPFAGSEGANSLEDWMGNKHPGVRHPSGNELPYMCKD